MSLNMKSLTQALAKTAAVIEKTVQTTVQEVTGPRPLQDYELLDQIGSGGPGLAWKLYAARPRPSAPSTQYAVVCVWLLDKRALSESRTRAGLTRATEDSFLEVIRADASRLVRIRHPRVIHVVQALDESKNAMAMVTEPLFASVANTVGQLDNITKVPAELKGMEMGLLEVKHGLLQIAESLDFLHNNAHLIHRAISPESVFITSAGAWKLGGFGFAIAIDQASSGLTTMQTFHYPEYDVEDSILPLQPSLNYTAPELVRSQSSTVGSSADIFSFACLAYHLITRKPLFDCHNNVKMYMNSLSYLTSESFSPIPSELVVDIQRMLSTNVSSRPSSMEFSGSSFFRDDTRLRALRFLDHMLERDNMQKTEFLKALSDMWKDFDARILRYKVLPPLCAELRNMVMQPMILPMVLTIAKSQDKDDFELSTLPSLVPVLTSASGETLLLLVKHADLLVDKVTREHLLSHVLPLIVRAFDDSDTRTQEEVLRRTLPLARQLEMQMVKQAILPRVHGLALRTTVAAVRVNALRCLGDLVSSLDKQSVLDILQTLHRCTTVDHSAPTLMCTLGVSHAIYKQFGLEFAVEHVLPQIFPLLMAQQLSIQQFSKHMIFIKDILRKIEEKRGVTLTEHGTSEARISPSLPNELRLQGGPALAAKKKTSSWDEDWGPINQQSSAASSRLASNNSTSEHSVLASHPISVAPVSVRSSAPPINQQTTSIPPGDVEWPPPNASNVFVSQSLADDKLNRNSGGPSDRSFDDIDPFANWPPRPNGSSISRPNSSNKPNSMTSRFNADSGPQNFDFSSNNNFFGSKAYQENAVSANNDSLSMGLGQSIGRKANNNNDIGSANSSGHTAPKIAPPPPTAVGRSRGRNKASLSTRTKLSSEQPPILDLL